MTYKVVLLLFLFLIPRELESKSLIEKRAMIAVIDTGLTVTPENNKFLCYRGHKSFTDSKSINDDHKSQHGNNIASILIKHIDSSKACLLILKFWGGSDTNSISALGEAMNYAADMRVSYVNLSVSGTSYSEVESKALKRLLEVGAKIAVAAGNGEERKLGSESVFIGVNLDQSCNIFPACNKTKLNNPNFHVVGATGAPFSNFGTIVTSWESGTQQGTPKLSGTSQATANFLGKLVKAELSEK